MEHRGPHPGQIDELFERLDALTARLDQQSTIIAEQRSEIARLRAQSASPAPAQGATTAPPPVDRSRSATSNRRAAITRVLGATAAGAVLALAKQAERASADYRGTATGGGASTASFGIAAIPGAGIDPTTLATALGSTAHGVVGTLSTTPPSPLSNNSGVLGLGSGTSIGVQGIATAAPGVFGRSTTHEGVLGTTVSTLAGVAGVSAFAVGATGATNGVYGETRSSTDTAAGVFGVANATTGSTVGTWGRSTSNATTAIGALGEVTAADAAGIGVKGISPNGPGVFGASTTAFGVQGLSTNAYGVSGNSTNQAGVWGSSNTNVGVLGTSTSGVGVNGVSTSSNGVNGLSTSGIGVYGSSSGGLAGRFDGNVVIQGNLTVSGAFPHTAAVPSSDGTLRRLYSLESAEAFYEDVGQGSLTNGVGTVTLDPDFAALVLGDTYHVFLTPRGDCNGIYISAQGPAGFEVRELRGGISSVGFSYRLMARPKDAPGTRLDRVMLPPAPAQPKLDRIEPLDVPATLRDTHHPDKPHEAPSPNLPPGPPSRVREGR
jgi:hypothetical protein